MLLLTLFIFKKVQSRQEREWQKRNEMESAQLIERPSSLFNDLSFNFIIWRCVQFFIGTFANFRFSGHISTRPNLFIKLRVRYYLRKTDRIKAG